MQNNQKSREIKGRQASVDGFAHEHITAGILMKRYQNVSLVDLPLSTYDLIIVRKDKMDTEEIIRAQVKTARKSIVFTGGTRGGVDREYRSGIKTYTQSPETADVVIGLHPLDKDSFELYFVPTVLIEKIQQKSLSLNKIKDLKNNFLILENCKDKNFVFTKCKEYKIL